MRLAKGTMLHQFVSRPDEPRDLCSLFGAFVGWTVLWAGATFCAGYILLGVVTAVVWIYTGVTPPNFLEGTVVITAVILALVFVLGGMTALQETRRGNNITGAIGKAYRGVKDRYCPLVNWTSPDDVR